MLSYQKCITFVTLIFYAFLSSSTYAQSSAKLGLYRHDNRHSNSWPNSHKTERSNQWPTEHIAKFSMSWPYNHSIDTSKTWDAKHSVARSNNWPVNHLLIKSNLWNSRHLLEYSLLWPNLHSATFSVSWPDPHKAARSDMWSANHKYIESRQWILNLHSITLSKTWPANHKQDTSTTWTTTPEPIPGGNSTTYLFADNQSVNNGNGRVLLLPAGYRTMTIKNETTGHLDTWSPLVSFDGGSTWHEQHRFRCDPTCKTVTIPVLSNLYRFSSGSGNGTVTSLAELNIEPNSKALVIGKIINYPFASEPFDATGYSKMILTVGGGNNPQNLNSVTLQKDDGNGNFIDVAHVQCDGGAECELKTLNITNGTFKLVLHGTGAGAVLGAILLP